MELKIYLYLTFALLWWQLAGSRSDMNKGVFDESSPEFHNVLDFWLNSPASLFAPSLLNFGAYFLLLYPLYFGYQNSVLHGFVLLIIGNIGMILSGKFLRFLGLPIKHFIHLAAILCPVLIVFIVVLEFF